jgi:hypothetical protein
MRRRHVLKRKARLRPAAQVPEETELALNVVVLYEDPLTWEWTKELWERLANLIGTGDVHRSIWRIGDLASPEVFAEAVRAAATAQVLVISLRDAGMLPPPFCEWVEAWVPHRLASGGAMVALIGVQPRPDAASGQAYSLLESVARRAGLDFLPHERRLPDHSVAHANHEKIVPEAHQKSVPQAGYTVGAGI